MATRPNVIIYILCYNDEKLKNSNDVFKKYYWARPILMKYQDITCENAFWKQLLEISSEWTNCEMVGTLSWKACKKMDIRTVDAIIKRRDLWSLGYYHFFVSTKTILEDNSHKHLQTIIKDINKTLNLDISGKCCWSNYWMCTPNMMFDFIKWVTNTLIPTVLLHELCMEDADYREGLNAEECLKKWGLPYYPHLCFVIERLIPCYFETNIASKPRIFLISHERNLTGAPIALNNLNRTLSKYNFTTELLYIKEHQDIVRYIFRKDENSTVICNTITLFDTVKSLTAIKSMKVYWYIHEWLDEDNFINIDKNISDKSVLKRDNLNFIFPCETVNKQYHRFYPFIKSIIVNHYYDLENIKKLAAQTPLNFNPNKGVIIISIIGTICKRKNQQRFIQDVFYKLVDMYPNIILQLVGFSSIKLSINPLYLNSIKFVGEVENSLPYINISDIIVSYSINEVLPLNIVESMYCEKAIISSDVGGINEIIKHDETGYLFMPNDSDTCFNQICSLIENPDIRVRLGKAAKEMFIARNNEAQSISHFYN